MGLDTSHDVWHGPYSAFSRWRHTLAEVAGYTVVETGEYKLKTIVPPEPWTRETLLTKAHVDGYWEEPPSDPLLILLAHSDCDGWLFPHDAGPLADRLEELLPQIPGDASGFVVEVTKQFIAGLRKAAEEWEVVTFH